MPSHCGIVSLSDLDPLLNGPKRLAVMGALANSKRIEFSFLREYLGLSKSDLSKQMAALTERGYVTSKKVGKGRTRTTWYTATPTGRDALTAHVAALNALASVVVTQTESADT